MVRLAPPPRRASPPSLTAAGRHYPPHCFHCVWTLLSPGNSVKLGSVGLQPAALLIAGAGKRGERAEERQPGVLRVPMIPEKGSRSERSAGTVGQKRDPAPALGSE